MARRYAAKVDTTAKTRKTAAQRRVESAIRAWMAKQDKHRPVRSVSHIYPRAYVLAQVAAQCLVVAAPGCDAEPQIRERCTGFGTVRRFDPSLTAGAWCSMAYVSTDGSGEPVAIPVVP